MIDRIVFDDEAETLAVSFRSSRKYLYHGVPRAIYDAFAHAQSAGQFFNDCVKGHFRCEAVGRRYRPE